jgi:hypothetical protein
MGRDIREIESQNKGLQVQTANQKALHAELVNFMVLAFSAFISHLSFSPLFPLSFLSFISLFSLPNLFPNGHYLALHCRI